jgi:hypothetical protein
MRTNVPGIEFCEHMPLQARMADKLAILRGVRTVGNHTGNEFFSGFAYEDGKPLRGDNQQRPAIGSVVSRMWGPRNNLPPYVSLHDNASWEHPYYLGGGHQPFRTHQKDRDNQAMANMRLAAGVSRERLGDRQALLRSFDDVRREIDSSGLVENLDANTARALEIVTSSHVRDAFDLSKEPAQLRALYGTAPAAFNFVPGMEFLLARRLIRTCRPRSLEPDRYHGHGGRRFPHRPDRRRQRRPRRASSRPGHHSANDDRQPLSRPGHQPHHHLPQRRRPAHVPAGSMRTDPGTFLRKKVS